MQKPEINIFDILSKCKRAHIKIDGGLFEDIKQKIIKKYGSITDASRAYGVEPATLRWEFRRNAYHPFDRILRIIADISLPKHVLYDSILGFYAWGSHRKDPIAIPRLMWVTPDLVEGFALYLAEGDNGSNGTTKPRKIRFTNANPAVIQYFMGWLDRHFNSIPYYVTIINPLGSSFSTAHWIHPSVRIHQTFDAYNTAVKYRVCLDSSILIDVLLGMNHSIKKLCLVYRELAAAYIRGMMAGEGTVYFNKSRYVRIEMRNPQEMVHIHQLFLILGFECKLTCRNNRHDMWSIYIGASQLKKYSELIGFGAEDARQELLMAAAHKQLQVNQYG